MSARKRRIGSASGTKNKNQNSESDSNNMAGMTTQTGEETGKEYLNAGQRETVFPHINNKRRGVRTLKDLIGSIKTKEANKAIEIAQEGLKEDEKSSSSGSDSEPSADELDVSIYYLYEFKLERANDPIARKYTSCG